MAGYSSTPLARKLGIKPDGRVALLAAPGGFESMLAPMPAGARVMRSARKAVDVVVAFARTDAQLDARLARGRELLKSDGGLWIAWPKKSTGVQTSLDFDAVQGAGLLTGLVDNKVCAMDDTWSALRFVVRRADRAAWSQ